MFTPTDEIAGATDLQRASMTRSDAIAGTPKAATQSQTNVVKKQLLADQAQEPVDEQWQNVHDAVCAAQDAWHKALEDDPKADPDKTFVTCMNDLAAVLAEIRDGKAGNIFDQLGPESTSP